MKSAKSGWAKAKKVGGRLSVMRLLRRTTDQQVQEQSKKRIFAASQMTEEEKLKLFGKDSNFLTDEGKYLSERAAREWSTVVIVVVLDLT